MLLADFHLQLSGIGDLLAVQFSDDVAHLKTRFGAGRIRLNLRDHAPLASFTSKNFAFSGVTSVMPTPMCACSTLP